jgi:hypothetical protein
MPLRRLQVVLGLVALHSAGVGIGLIGSTASLLDRAGFRPVGETFFVAQGGVFHLVMAVAYVIAAWDPVRQPGFVVFSIVVKVVATIFLTLYWAFVSPVPTILASALVDGAMGLGIWVVRRAWLRDARAGGS